MRRRRRALALLLGSVVCGISTFVLASRLENEATAGYGPLRPVVVVSTRVDPGRPLGQRELSAALVVRRVPAAFVPPGTLREPDLALGLTPVAALPAGTYLQRGLLQSGTSSTDDLLRRSGRRPVEVAVTGAGALTVGADGGGGFRVDVVVSGQPGFGGSGTEVVASGVPLIRLARPESAGEGWRATVGVSRRQALELIAAESSGRAIRLLPLSVGTG